MSKRRNKKTRTPQYYCDKFAELMNNEVKYRTENKEPLIIEEGEVFKQCWADTPTRKTLPAYWFVSNRTANVLSVYEDELVWIKKNPRKRGSVYYKYTIQTEDGRKIKNIEAHNLSALVFESEVYGKAKQLLEEKGVYAFGKKKMGEVNANGHHKDGDNQNNQPDNVQIISTPVHILLDQIPNKDSSNDKEIEFMQKFSKLASEEEPNKITILLTDELGTSIHATKQVTPSDNVIRQLCCYTEVEHYE